MSKHCETFYHDIYKKQYLFKSANLVDTFKSDEVHLTFKEQGIILDVGDIVEDRDESECGTA